MNKFQSLLEGGDLRSIGKANEIVDMIHNQADFDELFENLMATDRKIVRRAADAMEKITLRTPEYLLPHKKTLLQLCQTAKDIELKWHLALLIPRLSLTSKELHTIWNLLSQWASDATESKIVRVNAIQSLFYLLPQIPARTPQFHALLTELEKEKIPSSLARIRKLRKAK